MNIDSNKIFKDLIDIDKNIYNLFIVDLDMDTNSWKYNGYEYEQR